MSPTTVAVRAALAMIVLAGVSAGVLRVSSDGHGQVSSGAGGDGGGQAGQRTQGNQVSQDTQVSVKTLDGEELRLARGGRV